MNSLSISEEILSLFKAKKNIVLLPHIIPDGDTLGSSLALKAGLEKMHHKVFIVLDDEIPNNLNFLIKNKCVYTSEQFCSLKIIPDLIITIDCSDIDRLEDRRQIINDCENILNIDHHKTNSFYGKFNLIDKNSAATGEIIYTLLKELNVMIDKDMATSLYVALSTDTGSFKYSNTTSRTLRIAAELLDKKIDIELINLELYQNKPMNKVNLLKETLNTLETFINNRVSIMCITQKSLEKSNLTYKDTDGIVEFGRDIEGIEIAILIKEISSAKVKVGLRSKGNIDVSKIAKIFGGGGHKNASGCTIDDNIENAKKLLLKAVEEELR